MSKKFTVRCPECYGKVDVEVKDNIGEVVICHAPGCGCEFEVTPSGEVVTEDDCEITCPDCGHSWLEHDLTDYPHYTVCPDCGHDFETDLEGTPLDDEEDDEDEYEEYD